MYDNELVRIIDQCKRCPDYYEYLGRQQCRELPVMIVEHIQAGGSCPRGEWISEAAREWNRRLAICRACPQYMDGGGYIDGCQLAPGDCCARHDIRRHGKCEMGKW